MQAIADREETREQLTMVQDALARIGARYEAEYGRDPVDYALAEIGGNSGRGLAGTDNTDPDLLGAISIELIDPDLRPYSSFDFVAALQEEVPRHPLLEELSFRGWSSGPGGDAIDVRLTGGSTQTLKDAAEELKAELGGFGEVSALEDSLAYDKQEYILDLTPTGEALGFTIDGIGRVLRDRLTGIEAATYPDGTRSAAIRVELPEAEMTADFLDRLVLPTPAGRIAQLSDIVSVEVRQGFSTIRRENGVRQVDVTGDIDDADPARANEIMAILADDILPRLEQRHGIDTELSGLAEEEDAFLADALVGFLLCLVGIYLTLAWIFASWSRPAVVMAVIPFGLVGAIWGHYVWGVPLSLFSVVGLIGMTGIIINDSIVLVSTIDEHAGSRGIRQAIVSATCDRLRPVILTTATTVLGLAPLLYESSSQAQFLKPTVITLCYGLGFGMVLVLLVVPALVAIQGDAHRALGAARRALGRRAGPVRTIFGAAALAMAALFGATFGPLILGRAALPPVSALGSGPAAALAAFTLGLLAITALAALLGAAGLARPAARRQGVFPPPARAPTVRRRIRQETEHG